MSTDWINGFHAGLAYAAAWCVSKHDQPTIAAEFLEAGECDFAHVDELEILDMAKLVDEPDLPAHLRRQIKRRLSILKKEAANAVETK